MGRRDGTREVAKIRRELASAARPIGIENLQSYLGSPLPVLGVRAADFVRVVRRHARSTARRSVGESRSLAQRLWAGRWYEERAFAIALLAREPRPLDARLWRVATSWVDSATGWALSDSLASELLAEEVGRDPHRWREVAGWTRSPNPWRRRSVLYAQSRLVRKGEIDRPMRLLHQLRTDPDRWVQRAVGTWLRECGKRDAPRLRAYLRREAVRLSATAITVATERCSPGFRAEIRARARPATPHEEPGRSE